MGAICIYHDIKVGENKFSKTPELMNLHFLKVKVTHFWEMLFVFKTTYT